MNFVFHIFFWFYFCLIWQGKLKIDKDRAAQDLARAGPEIRRISKFTLKHLVWDHIWLGYARHIQIPDRILLVMEWP